ncbi:hypothetical protein KC678_00190 [Candidatus Dojkabacteria bacterium]|uniref:5'-3' exonuclease domain-containing protein n=1 Tax=Candidatus Dojkabacteria bacterium TaxID=2099670 RepID=A0A955IET6_9BACT|nr:hypothetical protein [Candidatus Dojkabacteria bacterium]
MIPLIDGDILLHELGWSGEFKDKESGEPTLMDFDFVADLLDKKITLICEEVDATKPPIIFVTNSNWIQENKNRFLNEVPEYKAVFRYKIAKTKPYKNTRSNLKPFHFYNVLMYLDAHYALQISEDGYEADDMMAIMQTANIDNTIICSRDKDLRMVEGWHYSWECGSQKAIGPHFTNKFGSLFYKGDKLIGYGNLFFYYQMLVGDNVDTIPGLPSFGEKKAFAELYSCKTDEEAFKHVKYLYLKTLGKEQAKEYFLEQANLLWMVREKGKPYEILYN